MSISIQAKKRQKCFMIEPKDGVVQAVPSFTPEEEQGFAISKLELWQKAGVTDGSEVMDPNHKKLQQFQDITAQISSRGKDKNVPADAPAKMKVALESAQKAAAELSMLVQLSSLLQSNKILSLQSRYVESNPVDELSAGHEHQPAKDKPKELPVAQRIGIQRSSFNKARSGILSGLEHAKRLIAQRQEFASTLQQCKEDKSFSLCYVDRKNNKRVTNRKYEPKKDFIAADCSVHTPSNAAATVVAASATAPNATNLNNNKGVKWAARPAENATTTTSATTFVPILMGKRGIELSATEQAATIYTLQLTLLAKGGGAGSGVSCVVGTANAWGILQNTPSITAAPTHIANTDVAEMDVEASSTTETTDVSTNSSHHPYSDSTTGHMTDSVQALATHCRRRKHETLCRTAFARIKEECIRNATQWDVLGGAGSIRTSTTSVDGSSSDSEVISRVLQNVVCGTDAVLSTIVVVDVQDREVVLRVSEGLLLVIALVPITNSSSSVSSSSDSSGGVAWVNSALSTMTLRAMLHIVQPTADTTSATARTNASISQNVFSTRSMWRNHAKPAGTAGGSSGGNGSGSSSASSSGSTAVLITRLLDLLFSRVEAKKAK